MTIKKFLLISVMIHAIVFVGIYFLPEQKTKKAKEFFTRLVTPEQAKVREITPPPPVKSIPIRPRPLPAPSVSKTVRQPPPVAKIPPKTAPSPDRPVVPDEGNDYGKPLPDGRSPRPGSAEKGGDGGPEEISSKPGYLNNDKKPGRRGPLTMNELFDRNVIGNAALKGEGGKRKDDTLTFDTHDYRYAGYMRKLKKKIESIWEYPPDAARKGLYGDLKISFTIKKDGRLGAVELIRTSGYKMLDDAALKALKDGEPYWPIPDDWDMESYTVSGHFFYTIYGYGIR